MESKNVHHPSDNNLNATSYSGPSCTRAELASQYMPYASETLARRKFNTWLRNHTTLRRELEALGVTYRTRVYTPQQVQLIYQYLGLPETKMPYW